ncbi:hypothetical protein [Brucella sp. IR073]|uniref:hypothetical protein n=1 Tax=unclassified Brucella TaxID=2632610 RepID=UPI003B9838E6
MTTPLDESPCDYIAAEYIEAMLGVSGAIVEDLVSNRFLRPLVAERLRACLLPLPEDLPTQLKDLFGFVCISSPDERKELSRYLCVLMNHEAIRKTTNGELLRALADWCSDEAIIYLMRGEALPALRSFRVLSGITRENIELYAVQVDAWLVGCLPQAYHDRLRLRFRPDEQPFSLPLPGDEKDRNVFLDLAMAAWTLQKQGGR